VIEGTAGFDLRCCVSSTPRRRDRPWHWSCSGRRLEVACPRLEVACPRAPIVTSAGARRPAKPRKSSESLTICAELHGMRADPRKPLAGGAICADMQVPLMPAPAATAQGSGRSVLESSRVRGPARSRLRAIALAPTAVRSQIASTPRTGQEPGSAGRLCAVMRSWTILTTTRTPAERSASRSGGRRSHAARYPHKPVARAGRMPGELGVAIEDFLASLARVGSHAHLLRPLPRGTQTRSLSSVTSARIDEDRPIVF